MRIWVQARASVARPAPAGSCLLSKLLPFVSINVAQVDQPQGCRTHVLSYFVEAIVWQIITVLLCRLPDKVVSGDDGQAIGPRETKHDTHLRHHRSRQYGQRGGQAFD